MARAIILTGGNVGDVKTRLQNAQRLINQHAGPVMRCSHRYKSRAWGFDAEEEFSNQVLEVDTDLMPEQLLDALQAIERELGRDREAEQSLKQRTGARYTSRPIDIDILFYDDRVIRTERLTVPHPLIQEREFVLVPLCEWMRDYRHPVLGKTVGELLEELKIGMKPMKKHKFKILTFVAVAAALAGTGCFKSIGYETFYVLRPWAQEGTVKTPIPREDMLAYAFDADTTEWSVLSYEDAVAGIITSRRTGEKLRPIAQGEPYEIDGNENWLAMQLNGPRFLILAVDQSNRLYGFTEQAIGENLPQMHVSVTFYPKEKADVS